MGDTRNYAALEWVIGEIGDTLKEARQALEAYVEDPKDSTRIRFCLTHIHQVYGTLQMVEFHGASLLAEEMEHLAQALLNDAVSSAAEAHEVLMRSLLQLPIYLDHVKTQRDDHPGVILPLLNDLRAVRKQSYLSETNLFAPDLTPARRTTGSRHPATADTEKLKQVLHKLREMYQFAAAAVLRGVKVEENLGYLNKVCSRLESLTAGTPCFPTWNLAAALAEGLERDDIELSVAVRGLLRHLARELRVLVEKCPQSFNNAPRENLLKNLLYYVARADEGSDRINKIKQAYQLEHALLFGSKTARPTDKDFISAPDPEAIRSVVVALQDEINSVKHILDISLTGQGGLEDLVEVLPIVKRVADTLAVLGIGDLRKQIVEQYDVLKAICESGELDEDRLMQVAGRIIEIEHRLQAVARGAGKGRDLSSVDERGLEIDQAKAAVLAECQKGLEQAKDAIVEYIASKWDSSHLVNVSGLMSDIRGGLEIIPLPRPAAIMGSCGRYVQEQLLDAQITPDWKTLDKLADTIASVDYYLERLREDREEDLDGFLEIAEQSIQSLGYTVTPRQTPEPAPPSQTQSDSVADEARAASPAIQEGDLPSDTPEVASSDNAAVDEPTQQDSLVEPSSDVPENIQEAGNEIGLLGAESLHGEHDETGGYEVATQPDETSSDETETYETDTFEADTYETDISEKGTSETHEQEDASAEPAGDEPIGGVAFADEGQPELAAKDEDVALSAAEDITADGDTRTDFDVAAGPDASADDIATEVATVADEEEEQESDIDDEIIEIFIEEAGEVLETLAEFFPQWRQDPSDHDSLTIVRRAFHTLKGSGRMVEALAIGELAWSIENMLNRIIDNTIVPQEEHFALIDMVLAVLPDMVKAFEERQPNPHKALTEQYLIWAFAAADGKAPSDLQRAASRWQTGDRSSAAEAEPEAQAVEVADEADDADEGDDLVLWEIFASEAESHLTTVEDFIQQMEDAAPLYTPPSDNMQRALHTLKGSAHMAHVTPIAELATPLESFVKELRSYQVGLTDDILQLIRDGVSYTRVGLEDIEHGRSVELPKLPQFLARTAELRELSVGHLVRQREVERDGLKQVDPRLLSIFMAEEMKLLLDADQILSRWQQDLNDLREINPLVTELTTLQAGATQANLPEMAELSELLRSVYLGCLAGQVTPSEPVLAQLAQGHELLLDMVDAVAAGQNLQPPSSALLDSFKSLLASEELADSQLPEGEPPSSPPDIADEFPLAGDVEEISYDLAPAETGEDAPVPHDAEADYETLEYEMPVDSEQSGSHAVEAEPFTEEVAETSWQHEELPFLELEESESEPSVDPEPTASSEPSAYVEEPSADIEEPFVDFEEPSADPEEPSANTEEPSPGTTGEPATDLEALSAELPEYTIEFEEPSAEFNELSAEHEEPLAELEELSAGDEQPSTDEEQPPAEGQLLSDDEHFLNGSGAPTSESSGLTDEFVELDEPSDVANGASLEERDPASTDDMLDGESPESSDAATMGDDLSSAEWDVTWADELQDEVNEPAVTVDEHQAEFAAEVVPDDSSEEEAEDESEPAVTSAQASSDESVAQDASGEHNAAPVLDLDDEDFDQEIIEIFLEEADELVDELDEAIHNWEADRANTESPETMARALHTLKGGARLANLMDIGELTHDYETFLLGRGREEVDQAFFDTIHVFQDKLLRSIKSVRAALAGEAPPPEPAAPTVPVAEETDERDETEAVEKPGAELKAPLAPSKGKVVPFAPKPKEILARSEGGSGFNTEFSMPAGKSGGPQPAAQVAPRRSGPQEVIKISAELLEELVNLAGETSISRGRLETQINDLAGAIDEIDGTLSRLQEQLRRLDIETEAQIIFRQEQLADHEDFDPLEMDRYSALQQLSRSLMESASDLVDLKSTLNDKVKDTETLLLQQSRVNTNLQEGLMRSRMVPFSRLVPRLRRIVRQVATELGKDVNFELDNIEGEMDRSVLERMVAPLEHMLRNAVDHGIEKPADRAKAGKGEVGRIRLSLAREGGDVLLRLADDGRGIDLKRVREKAIERGLMSEDAQLTDHDIMQFILHAGFSTAENVTQISGRGVGMDVVHAEIKQLGGAMSIASRSGEGTEFSVRLPFTVSVNRALMVNLGQDQYAIPLNAIEGIVRVSPFELEHYYSNPDARFEYAGENFRVRYLGSMLNEDVLPRLEAQSLPLPVILVRSEQHTMALQVDSLMGSREIVVKSLGTQFSTVQGLSGATVMGDGSVVVILDVHALVRKEMAQAAPAPVFAMEETARLAQQEAEVLKTVMVVDDSVTVRKVTTRFLEREGYNVITAKDGVDALRILQDEIPDIMLLDIEMPRMDGFEVAKNVRTSSRWQDIPIIMITSRTGEKHREHALSLGVNRYMGKPYQEEALLESINELLTQGAK